MSRSKIAIVVLAAAVVTAGCNPTREDEGKVAGAIIGGIAGNQIGHGKGRVLATVVGAAVGHFIGGQIGRTMDENDRLKAERALETSPTNESIAWTNPDSGSRYEVTPTKTYYQAPSQQSPAQPCREYTTEAWIGGKKETVYGTACRQADGSWLAKN